VYLAYYLLPFLAEFYIELGLGLDPLLQLAFYPTSYIIYFIVFYIINSVMEEGVFRGLMMRCFMTKYNVNIANIIQAIFFGFWQIVWPINYFINGWIDPITAGWFAVYYVVSSFGFGIVTGYMFQKTSSLTGPIVLHTLWNFTIFMTTVTYSVPPDWAVNIFLYGTMLAVEYVGLAIAFLIIREFSRQRKLPELTPWDASLPK
jgi:membrane protease YdiL (CAAX protease family)